MLRGLPSNWDEWKAKCTEENRSVAKKLVKDREAGHVCLIVGYNKNTGEIAISDSWGSTYELRWITEDETEAVSQNSFSIIEI